MILYAIFAQTKHNIDKPMIIQQISIQIADHAGASWKVFQTLADHGINILSYSIEDAPEYGTLRLIVDNVRKANEVLTTARFQTFLTDVYSLNVPNEPGSMSKVLRRLADNNISLEYLYAFQYQGISQAILRSHDMNELKTILDQFSVENLNA